MVGFATLRVALVVLPIRCGGRGKREKEQERGKEREVGTERKREREGERGVT